MVEVFRQAKAFVKASKAQPHLFWPSCEDHAHNDPQAVSKDYGRSNSIMGVGFTSLLRALPPPSVAQRLKQPGEAACLGILSQPPELQAE